MITWDEAILDCQDKSSDSSAGSLSYFKRHLNIGYKKVLAEFGVQQNERTQTTTTVASQQYYQVPYDLIAPKSITLTNGTTVYPITFVESQEQWDNINIASNVTSTVPQYAFYRPRFGVNGGDIGLWPVPSTSAYTMTMVYVATDKNMTQAAYSTGTIVLSNASASVTGSGTTFTPQMVGRYFQVTDSTSNSDGQFYKVATVLTATTLTLEQTYAGASVNGVTYQIAEMFALPEEMQILPIYYALWQYYLVKQNDEKLQEYRGMFKDELATAKETWSRKTRTSKIRHGRPGRYFPMATPFYFPSSGISGS